jgi:hypothetical protein
VPKIDRNNSLRLFSLSISYVFDNERGLLLYQRLRSTPVFWHRVVGVKVDEFRTYSELIDDGTEASLPGIAITSGRLCQRSRYLETNKLSVRASEFRSGLFWQPYEGEVYQPLVTHRLS